MGESNIFNDFENVIIQDLIALFRRKGLERFQRFEIPEHEWSNEEWVFGEIEGEHVPAFNFEIETEMGDGEYFEFK